MIPKKEYGDFQTSLSLARRIAALVEQDEMHFGTIIEPTCGIGAFLQAAVERFGRSPKYWGFDVNPDYVKAARAALARVEPPTSTVQQRDFYATKWEEFALSQTSGMIVTA